MTTHRRKTVALDLDEAAELISLLYPFRLRGQTDPPTLWAMEEAPGLLGLLPPEYSEEINLAEYVVMSFRTPIAWVTDGQAVVPDVGYSPTTSQHQYLAAHALRVPFRPARGRKTVRVPANATQNGRLRRLRRGGIDGPDDPEVTGPNQPSPLGRPWAEGMIEAGPVFVASDRGRGKSSLPPERDPGWRSPAHP